MGTPNNTSPSPNKAKAEDRHIDSRLTQWVKEHGDMLNILLDAYCVIDVQKRIVNFNVAFTDLCGESYRKVSKVGDFCSYVCTELCPKGCPADKLLGEKKMLRLDELLGRTKAQPELHMILAGMPIFAENDELIGSLVTIRDVSAESKLQQKYDERKKESILDGLTGVFNKVYTEEFLLKMLKDALRENKPLTVVMCDVDHFKKVNDTYGHQAGDYVLSIIAQLLKDEARATDVVGRFGGEEFMAVLAKSEPDGAKIFAERFRNRVHDIEIVFEGNRIPVSVSLGTASFNDTWTPGLDPQLCAKEIITQADTALYFAKANGRNQTCQFETIPKQGKKKKAS